MNRGRVDELNENINKKIGNIKWYTKHKKEPVRNEEYIRALTSVAQLGGVSSCKPTGCPFDSWLGHTPGWRV